MIVIADSSALVALSICNVLELLEPLFGEVRVPKAVFDELTIADKPESQPLRLFLADKVITASLDLSTLKKTNGLGRGELEAIALYQQLDADLLLIDDTRAKKVAYLNNLEVMGSLGVLLHAKHRGFIKEIRPLIDNIKCSDIFISDALLEQILKMVGED